MDYCGVRNIYPWRRGISFRRVSTRGVTDRLDAPNNVLDQATINLLSEFCIVDHWSANLANAMLKIGPRGRELHGLPVERTTYGLLELVRCYDDCAHDKIIKLFEHAAFESRPFNFSAVIRQPSDDHRIVHCFGAYRSLKDQSDGEELYGVFLFSRGTYGHL